MSLPTDLLCLLFSFNVEIPDAYRPYDMQPEIFQNQRPRKPHAPRKEHPLNELRRYSQVCRQWRHLALDSPSLWAALIDIGYLEHGGKNNWRAEVLRRTKQVPLSVFGQGHARFFFFLMKKEWTRVRHVDVQLLGMSSHDHWDVFGTPAPALRTLRLLGFAFAFPPITLTSQAPLLRVLSIPKYPHFDPRAMWVIQLRRLDLKNSTFALGELLEVLPQMTQLEHLYIDCTRQGTSTHLLEGEITPIALPCLSTLVLFDDFLSTFAVLARILPNPSAIVRIDIYSSPELLLPPADLHAESRIFALHLQNHMLAGSSFTVKSCDGGVSITSVSPSTPSTPHFRFCLLCNNTEAEAATLLPLFLDLAFQTDLPGVREVELVCDQHDGVRRRAVIDCDDALILNLLPRVTVLRLSTASLGLLHSHSPTALPMQGVQKLALRRSRAPNQARALAVVLQGLLRRKDAEPRFGSRKRMLGSDLRTIEFNDCHALRTDEGYAKLEDALGLAEAEGIEVVWKEDEGGFRL
ncbi:hypothetical protein NLJ89_g5982 [Agrocybe chaxingu]|uniref:F-box domain-containing protein n=1 Tax=Agrocybe chaxingu TaxID=84603 RepID=A0A9W8K1I9_9AGAR|nr:hypothetical protein NLJ89_g5982 [Agrocybe chaxingu]